MTAAAIHARAERLTCSNYRSSDEGREGLTAYLRAGSYRTDFMKPNYSPNQGEEGVRENLSLEYQVNEQLRTYRMAQNIGDIAGASRSLSVLKGLLWQWFPADKKRDYLKVDVNFRQRKYEDFYSEQDMADLKEYDDLETSRIREIKSKASSENKITYARANERRLDIIMSAVKQLNLGLQTKADAEISHDKKKLARMGKPS